MDSDTRPAARKILASRYFEEISIINMTDSQIADLTSVGERTVRRWYKRDTAHSPSTVNLQKLGELAAVCSFLSRELSFEPEETQAYLERVYIDPETHEPVTALDLIKRNEIPSVIQGAIAASIEN